MSPGSLRLDQLVLNLGQSTQEFSESTMHSGDFQRKRDALRRSVNMRGSIASFTGLRHNIREDTIKVGLVPLISEARMELYTSSPVRFFLMGLRHLAEEEAVHCKAASFEKE